MNFNKLDKNTFGGSKAAEVLVERLKEVKLLDNRIARNLCAKQRCLKEMYESLGETKPKLFAKLANLYVEEAVRQISAWEIDAMVKTLMKNVIVTTRTKYVRSLEKELKIPRKKEEKERAQAKAKAKANYDIKKSKESLSQEIIERGI